MATEWDDDDENPKPTRVRPPPIPQSAPPRLPDPEELEPPAAPPRPSRRALPWLVAGLSAAALAASASRGLQSGARARQDLSAARDEAADFRGRLFHTEDELRRAEKARAEQTAAANRLESAAIERDQNARLVAELKSQLDAKDGEVSQERNEIAVNLVDQILFKSGDADLSPRGKEVLARVGAVLKNLSDKQILIGGHTDSRPIHTAQFPSNWELSSARAVNVVRYLAETAGVDPARLTAAGYSQFHPRGRSLAKNRRIEILLTPIVTIKKN